MKTKGVLVITVVPGSLAEEAGIQPGDFILEINGEAVLDQLSYQFLVGEQDETEVTYQDPSGQITVALIENGGDGLGLDLAEDDIKICK
ncbi:MAG: PDZ domain-containing protein, partial [Holophaga sp.]|nr:PDZ domain-containing protein [Holophaga sp.]